MKYYITKYALTGGIQVVEGSYKNTASNLTLLDEKFNNTENFVIVGHSYLHKNKDIFDNKEDAEKNFEEKKNKKIASLKKQIAKLEKMTVKYEDKLIWRPQKEKSYLI